MPFLGEAMRAFEEGVGSAEDIDAGAKIGLNHPMGPLALADFIGLDVCKGIMIVLHEGLGGEHFRPPQVLSTSSRRATSARRPAAGSTATTRRAAEPQPHAAAPDP